MTPEPEDQVEPWGGQARLIEDWIPIEVIGKASTDEKVGGRKGHPSTLHLWWARRPLAAARAAVYATLVPATGRTRTPEEEASFFDALCRWGAGPAAISDARAEILAAYDGIPPKVLDMFAGGGAIPLEAARLGCEATAIELNPVAHLIERCMLEFPQGFPGLADDVRAWGKIWSDRVWERLEDLYPPVGSGSGQQSLEKAASEGRRPIAYLWTRTVVCPNPAIAAHRLHLVRQTWLGKKRGQNAALRAVVDRTQLTIEYEVVEASTPEGLGFDPAAGSRRGQATCQICGATVDAEYVKEEGLAGRLGTEPLAAVLVKVGGRGREYLGSRNLVLPDDSEISRRLSKLDVLPPEEELPSEDVKNFWAPLYGLTRYRDLFTPRQLLLMCTLVDELRLQRPSIEAALGEDRARAVQTYLALVVDRTADYSTVLCRWANAASAEKVNGTFARQALPMVWDFAEANPFGASSGDVRENVSRVAEALENCSQTASAHAVRASATSMPLADESQDAVITDPPYYDNISYADLSDFFYVWLRRAVGDLYPDHLGGELTPKRNEAIVAPYRHSGDKSGARRFYEDMMRRAFEEAHRVLRPDGPLVCIYAHKTTLGWATLVDALRGAGFTITEAWPLDTEMSERAVGQGTASLASSIFLVARKRREDAGIGSLTDVTHQLDGIVTERVRRLQDAGVSGSDLVIAAVGAGLRAFTRFQRVEQENGEELPADRFLTIVQNSVLDAIFGGLEGADTATRFYVAAQFSYGYAWVPFAEANNLAYMTGVELDGQQGLTGGPFRLVEKKGANIRLCDFELRGQDKELGIDSAGGGGRSRLIDVVHGTLWRAEYRPTELKDYLDQTHPDAGLLRSVIQALAGTALRGGAGTKAPEAAAAERLLASWRRLVDDNLFRKRDESDGIE
jgi:putative DNA methylase